jgi:hypothetical protein
MPLRGGADAAGVEGAMATPKPSSAALAELAQRRAAAPIRGVSASTWNGKMSSQLPPVRADTVYRCQLGDAWVDKR